MIDNNLARFEVGVMPPDWPGSDEYPCAGCLCDLSGTSYDSACAECWEKIKHNCSGGEETIFARLVALRPPRRTAAEVHSMQMGFTIAVDPMLPPRTFVAMTPEGPSIYAGLPTEHADHDHKACERDMMHCACGYDFDPASYGGACPACAHLTDPDGQPRVPACDCGAIACKTPHAKWCSTCSPS